jgi:hypothetical protein
LTNANPKYLIGDVKLLEHFDVSSIIVIVVTVILFALAVYHKGISHDLLLEAGVFLVSVKLIQSSYKSSVATKKLEEKLDQIIVDLNKKN